VTSTEGRGSRRGRIVGRGLDGSCIIVRGVMLQWDEHVPVMGGKKCTYGNFLSSGYFGD
jgi:hypothetical protein